MLDGVLPPNKGGNGRADVQALLPQHARATPEIMLVIYIRVRTTLVIRKSPRIMFRMISTMRDMLKVTDSGAARSPSSDDSETSPLARVFFQIVLPGLISTKPWS
jgi:hypothetical protein